MYKTPILLITFNRPEYTRRVLIEILKQEPLELYVCQDGPRKQKNNDKHKCQQVRDVLNELISAYATNNKDFTLHTLYQETNLGCGLGPATGITWFFENVEKGIILEDDCVPHPEFFKYCEELLERYKENERIGFVGGCNFIPLRILSSYAFSGGHHQTWGWATWRRAWQHFDYTLQSISSHDFNTILKEYCLSWRQKEYWWKIFEEVKSDQMNNSCWDYQFLFCCWKKHQLAIAPRVNLVSNIGTGEDATHTHGVSPLLYGQSFSILPLIHPQMILFDKNIDFELMRRYIAPYDYGWRNLLRRGGYLANRYLKRILGHQGPWVRKSKK